MVAVHFCDWHFSPVVQMFPSAHCPLFVQALVVSTVNTQWPFWHESMVRVLLSLHCEASVHLLLQVVVCGLHVAGQFVYVVCEHWFVVVLQRSDVHALVAVSLHWLTAVQQLATAAWEHALALQASVVQALLSLHCALVVQQPLTAR